MFTLVGFLAVFFQVDGDEDELEVGEEGLVEPVVAGGGLAVVLHAVENACSTMFRPLYASLS